MHNHEAVYETTDYFKSGVATGNVRRVKRKSLNVEQSASDHQAASESLDNQETTGADALDVTTDDAGNESNAAPVPNETEHGDVPVPGDRDASEPVATPEISLDMMLRLEDQLMQQALHQRTPVSLPQPLPTRVPPVQAPEDDLVETSGRAMLLRLRQLYEKDAKLFLRAQNDVSNAIFKYEVE